ncbi:MAG: phosphate ABC transporter permease PstA [Acidobacteriota bacterium]|nr:phosphate ABC transporter permease PstA [Acidobacteriota bacterium]
MSSTAMTPLAVRLLRGDPRLRRRRALNRSMEAGATMAALAAVAVLGIVIVSVLARGAGAINIDFFIHSEVPFGDSGGGIANAIVGSAVLVALASAMAVPVGILIGIHASEFARPRTSAVVRLALDILNGVPTIVTGIFIFGLLIYGGHQQSGFAGALALAIVMLPIVARAAQEVLALVPSTLKEGALALGATRWRTVVRVVLPTAAGGLLTGALLAVARVAGETAPLLFTSSILTGTGVSTNPGQALASIPFRIYQLAEGTSPAEHEEAWAAALLLIFLVLALNVIARAVYGRASARIRRAQ